MRYLLVCLALFSGSAAPAIADSPPAALPSGTLLFLENCSSVVERTTKGKIGHVAMVMADDSATWVYEATPAQVRRVTQDEYYAELARINARRDKDDPIRTWARQPAAEFSATQITAMRAALDEQLGRPYSVKKYVRDKPSDGIHCAELASTTLNASGRFAFQDCHRIHPSALYAAVDSGYGPPEEVIIPKPQRRNPGRSAPAPHIRLVDLVRLELPRSLAVLLVKSRFLHFLGNSGPEFCADRNSTHRGLLPRGAARAEAIPANGRGSSHAA